MEEFNFTLCLNQLYVKLISGQDSNATEFNRKWKQILFYLSDREWVGKNELDSIKV